MRIAVDLPLVALLMALLAGSAQASPRERTAEQAVAAYRNQFKATRELDCPRTAPDEIVVCGRGEGGMEPGRLPLPVEREPGERIAGEPLRDGGGCISRCAQPVMIPLHKAPALIGKIIERLKDDE